MENKKESVSQLMQQYLNNKLTVQEYSDMLDLLHENLDDNSFKVELQTLWQQAKTEQAVIPNEEWDYKMQMLKNKLNDEVVEEPAVQKRVLHINKYWWAAAAVFFIVLSSAIFYFKNTNSKDASAIVQNNKPIEHNNDRQPGGNKAMLTLADGSRIVLDSANNGVLAHQGNTKIIKEQNGQLIYNNSGLAANEITYNILETPRGGEYKIVLPDGSKVWLNAASSLKYPTAFIGNARKVEITGEAYFEIAKDASKPFKVQVNQMEVEVLGTHFNINGYADENVVRTTLLEGSVKINTKNSSNFLKPGQQAQVQNTGAIKLIDNANIEEIIAWKEGNFQFEDRDIYSVMRQLGRWYNMDIAYSGVVSKHFGGTISRNVNLSDVLNMLQQTGEVKFIMKGEKIIVSP